MDTVVVIVIVVIGKLYGHRSSLNELDFQYKVRVFHAVGVASLEQVTQVFYSTYGKWEADCQCVEQMKAELKKSSLHQHRNSAARRGQP